MPVILYAVQEKKKKTVMQAKWKGNGRDYFK